MKILVAYFSQTGNTKQVAEAIHQEMAISNETDLKKIEETGGENFSEYDLVFVGSPIHAGGLAAQVKGWLEALPENPTFKLAAFVSHASFAYEKQGFEAGVQYFDDISKDKNVAYLGCYDCQGRLAPELHAMVQQSQGLSDEDWAEKVAKFDEHPNAEDEQKAKDFAKEVLSRG